MAESEHDNQYIREYLKLVQETIDPYAEIDDDDNIVYVDDTGDGDPEIVVVTPTDAYRYINDMVGGTVFEDEV